MIELRWKGIAVADGITGAPILIGPQVLQYRQHVVKGAWAQEPPANAPTEWSEWIDVPAHYEPLNPLKASIPAPTV